MTKSHVCSCYSTEYLLSSLKVVTIVLFIVIGIFVNAGLNRTHSSIGGKNWHIEGAPFVDGFAGFARVFVTASFACLFSFSRHYSLTDHKRLRWRDGESWHHSWRDTQSDEEYAEGCQGCILAVYSAIHIHILEPAC